MFGCCSDMFGLIFRPRPIFIWAETNLMMLVPVNQLSTCSWHRRNRRFCEHRIYIYLYIYIYIWLSKKMGVPKNAVWKHGWWTGVADIAPFSNGPRKCWHGKLPKRPWMNRAPWYLAPWAHGTVGPYRSLSEPQIILARHDQCIVRPALGPSKSPFWVCLKIAIYSGFSH